MFLEFFGSNAEVLGRIPEGNNSDRLANNVLQENLESRVNIFAISVQKEDARQRPAVLYGRIQKLVTKQRLVSTPTHGNSLDEFNAYAGIQYCYP
jgi:hypothetical protein